VIGSVVTFAGLGVGNVLLPPLVKKYFPDRIGLVTSLYVTMLSLSTLFPPLIAVPVADAAGWRVSLGLWMLPVLVALVPWVTMFVRHRVQMTPGTVVEEAEPALVGRIWRSSIAWALAVVFAASSLNAYAMFAWLPEILVDTVKVSNIEAGVLLGIYSFIAVPGSILGPILVTRMRHPGWIIQAGVLFFIVGYAGLLLVPGTVTWLWVALIGMGPVLFPVCLTLINLRTRSQQASAALSGFAQAIGYTLGALGPLVVGVLHEATGGWTVPLLFCLAVAVVGIPFGIILSKPRYIEQDLEERS